MYILVYITSPLSGLRPSTALEAELTALRGRISPQVSPHGGRVTTGR